MEPALGADDRLRRREEATASRDPRVPTVAVRVVASGLSMTVVSSCYQAPDRGSSASFAKPRDPFDHPSAGFGRLANTTFLSPDVQCERKCPPINFPRVVFRNRSTARMRSSCATGDRQTLRSKPKCSVQPDEGQKCSRRSGKRGGFRAFRGPVLALPCAGRDNPRPHAGCVDGRTRGAPREDAMNQADTAWMLVATALVLLMTPALAFFYGGLVRSKNALNTMMMSFIALGFVGIVWAVIGYRWRSPPATRCLATRRACSCAASDWRRRGTIPHLLFMCYQGTFAIITAALISGAIVERMRFSAYVAFITLWSVVVYSPIAHWVWGGGWLAKMGALDFAGGTVVHVNAGVAAFVAALVVGKRRDYPSSGLLPHNVPFTLLGAGVLWFGWFGFNAGSALAANGIAALAFTATMLAPAGTLVVWTLLDAVRSRKPTAVGCATAIVVGSRRHHAGGRFRRTDERDRPRCHCRRAQLLRPDLARAHVDGRFARCGRGAWPRGHGRRAADRRVRAEGAQRRG